MIAEVMKPTTESFSVGALVHRVGVFDLASCGEVAEDDGDFIVLHWALGGDSLRLGKKLFDRIPDGSELHRKVGVLLMNP